MPIVAGRAFNEGDRANSPKVAVVNQSFVKKNPQRRQSIGARFQIEEEVGRARPVVRDRGLVRDTKYYDLRDEFAPEAYVTTRRTISPTRAPNCWCAPALPAGTLTQELKSRGEASPRDRHGFHVMEANILNSLLRERPNGHAFRIFGRWPRYWP